MNLESGLADKPHVFDEVTGISTALARDAPCAALCVRGACACVRR